MTEPTTTGEHRVIPLPAGDRKRVTPITRIVWVTGEDLPPGKMAEPVYDLDAKATVILIHESLATEPGARAAQRAPGARPSTDASRSSATSRRLPP